METIVKWMSKSVHAISGSIKPASDFPGQLGENRMKKLLLVSTAIAGVAMMSSPASAALKMDLGGYFLGYGVYADNDEAVGDDSLRNFEFRRDSEISFNGETTLDNGLTIGAHTEMKTTGNDSWTNSAAGNGPNVMDETYLYGSGQWGRLNFGAEDGAAYLLQVAAPSADSNVDGMRVYIQALNTQNWDGALQGASWGISNNNTPGISLDYQHADFRQVDRLTYLTPKFNGFQAGVSYAPTPYVGVTGGNTFGMSEDGTTDDFTYNDLWEASARWDGEFEGFGISLGGGYSDANLTVDAVGPDDLQTWNAGLNVAFNGWSLGGAYKHTNNGIDTNGDTTIWDVGGAWDNGPWHVGLSYFDANIEDAALSGSEADITRWTGGAGYTFGPGMTFRGAVAFGNFDPDAPGQEEYDFTQVTVGTDVQF
jgi:outer membrane protein OmpU